MSTLVKGFVVGRGPLQIRADGSSWSRNRLIELEAGDKEVAVAIGENIVWLDAEAATAFRNVLNDAIEGLT